MYKTGNRQKNAVHFKRKYLKHKQRHKKTYFDYPQKKLNDICRVRSDLNYKQEEVTKSFVLNLMQKCVLF